MKQLTASNRMLIQANTEKYLKLIGCEKKLYKCSKLGDCLVIGVAIVQSNKQQQQQQQQQQQLQQQQQQLEFETVKKALQFMQKRHPLLRAHLAHFKSTDDVFIVVKKDQDLIDLEWSTVNSRKEMIAELEVFNSKALEYDRLLWRSKVVKFKETSIDKYAIALVLPLFITDGINISTLTVEVVTIINSLLCGLECEQMKTRLELCDNLMVLGRRNDFPLNELIERDEHVRFVLAEEFKCMKEKGLKINLIRLSKDLSINLVKMSKEKHCKLTGLLNAAIIYALHDLYEENGLCFPRDLSVDIPANLRLRYSPNLDFSHIRFHVCLARFDLTFPKFGTFKNIWNDAAHINKQIAICTCVQDGSLFESTNKDNLTWVSRGGGGRKDENEDDGDDETLLSVTERCERMREETSHCDLVMSNIGTYVYERKRPIGGFVGPFTMIESYHGDSLNSSPNVMPALIFHISTWCDEIQVMLSSNKSAIGSIFVDRLALLFEKILINCANTCKF